VGIINMPGLKFKYTGEICTAW